MRNLVIETGMSRQRDREGLYPSQIRRLILQTFDDADVRHRWQTEQCEQLTIDDLFALLRNTDGLGWSLHSIAHESTTPPSTVLSHLGDFTTAESAVRRLVVLMATARVEVAIGKAVSRD